MYNRVFEYYVGTVLEQMHQVLVGTNSETLEHFLRPNRLRQKPDFY